MNPFNGHLVLNGPQRMWNNGIMGSFPRCHSIVVRTVGVQVRVLFLDPDPWEDPKKEPTTKDSNTPMM